MHSDILFQFTLSLYPQGLRVRRPYHHNHCKEHDTEEYCSTQKVPLIIEEFYYSGQEKESRPIAMRPQVRSN